MKTIKHMLFILAAIVVSACSEEQDKIGKSQIDTTPPISNELDKWLENNFVIPYNIDITYKWDVNQTDMHRYLHPPYLSSVKPLAEALLKVWVEPYTKLGGKNFIKKIAPRQFTFVGSFNFDPNSPTITLGLAEAGTKISLFNIDYLDYTEISSIIAPLKTVQHEYGHILNQNIPVDKDFGLINPENFTAQWYNISNEAARELGFITAYASSSENEDFVEMVSEMLTHSRDEWNAIIDGITSEQGKEYIRKKEAFVVEYYAVNFNIDIYELQELTYNAMVELVK